MIDFCPDLPSMEIFNIRENQLPKLKELKAIRFPKIKSMNCLDNPGAAESGNLKIDCLIYMFDYLSVLEKLNKEPLEKADFEEARVTKPEKERKDQEEEEELERQRKEKEEEERKQKEEEDRIKREQEEEEAAKKKQEEELNKELNNVNEGIIDTQNMDAEMGGEVGGEMEMGNGEADGGEGD